jgi:hypothetical protein
LRINLFSEAFVDKDPLAALRQVVTSVQRPSDDAGCSEEEWGAQEQQFQSWHEQGTAVTQSEFSQSSLWSQSSGTQSSGPIEITPVKPEPKPIGSLTGIILRPSVTGEAIDNFADLLASAESVRTSTKVKRKKQKPMSTIYLGKDDKKKLTIEFHWHAKRYLPEFVVLQYLILDFSATNGWVISVL